MRNAALGDGEGNVHASHDGEGGSDHHRPEAIHRHPRKVSKNRNGASPIPNIRAHQRRRARQKGGSEAERDTREALGRSRGGFGTKACVIADGRGRPVGFRLTLGQAHELPHALPLLDQLPACPSGSWPIAAIPATASATRSGPLERGRRSRPRTTRLRSPVLTRSITTATSSSDYGRASKNGAPLLLAMRRPPSASWASFVSLPPCCGSSDYMP